MGLANLTIVENLLTIKSKTILNDNLLINLKPDEAYNTRNSISKLIYKNLFTWIVDRVN